jgi:hypothetical protein
MEILLEILFVTIATNWKKIRNVFFKKTEVNL